MNSSDIENFILNSLPSKIKILLSDGSALTGLSIDGIEWNRDNFFNMWVLRFDDGLGSLIDGYQIESIINC